MRDPKQMTIDGLLTELTDNATPEEVEPMLEQVADESPEPEDEASPDQRSLPPISSVHLGRFTNRPRK